MIIKLIPSMQRSQSCISVLVNRSHIRSFSSSQSNHAQALKKVSEQKGGSEVSTSFAEKAKDNVKTGGYGLVIIGGLGLIAVVVGTIFKVGIFFTCNLIFITFDLFFRNYFLLEVPITCMIELSRSVKIMIK